MPQTDLEWTVMVYMAADNNLTPNAFQNLLQMSTVGSTERVHIVAQLDPEGTFSPAQRHFVNVGGGLSSQDLPDEPNTGAVEDFLSFIRWVVENGHKAKKYLLIFWGHGLGVSANEDDESSGGNPVVAGPNIQPLMLIPDASSDDALTSRELKQALEGATQILGVPKIDVLGMDACLMGMIEITRQVDDHASILVASEESVPDKSWPYAPILTRLTQQPEIAAQNLSRAIVDDYLAFYRAEDHGAVTLAACDLSKTGKLTAAMLSLADELKRTLGLTRVRRAIIRARGSSQSFLVSDYVDLFDLCQNFQTTLNPDRFKPATHPATTEEAQACNTIKAAAKEVMNAIANAENPSASLVLHAGTEGGPRKLTRLANSHGVSIYFPLIVPLYRSLEFSRATQWDSFLFDYMNTVFRPADVPSGMNVAAGGSST